MDLPCLGVCMLRSKQEPEVGTYLCNATSYANSYRGLASLTFCSSINKFCFWRMCIKNDSQIFILTPSLQGFNRSITLHHIIKYTLLVPVYSAPYTPNQDKSIKLINSSFPYIVIFYCILLYFTLFIAELHMRPHLPRFYQNNTLLYCILSF
jgi:hypothetical protein